MAAPYRCLLCFIVVMFIPRIVWTASHPAAYVALLTRRSSSSTRSTFGLSTGCSMGWTHPTTKARRRRRRQRRLLTGGDYFPPLTFSSEDFHRVAEGGVGAIIGGGSRTPLWGSSSCATVIAGGGDDGEGSVAGHDGGTFPLLDTCVYSPRGFLVAWSEGLGFCSIWSGYRTRRL